MASIPTASQDERAFASSLRSAANSVRATLPTSSSLAVSPDNVIINEYNGQSAVTNYANVYTDNGSKNEDCSGVLVAQYPKYYSRNYEYFPCDDCANFTSQIIHAGGVPTNAGWEPYDTGWNTVSGLEQAWSSDLTSIAWYDSAEGDFATSNSNGHIQTIAYNDGTTIAYDGHNNDRQEWTHNGYWGPLDSTSVYYRLYIPTLGG